MTVTFKSQIASTELAVINQINFDSMYLSRTADNMLLLANDNVKEGRYERALEYIVTASAVAVRLSEGSELDIQLGHAINSKCTLQRKNIESLMNPVDYDFDMSIDDID